MDTIDPARFIFASFFILGLLGLFAVFLKYYGKKISGQNFLSPSIFSGFAGEKKSGRLAIIETIYIDNKSKIVLLRLDDVEHLLLVGENNTIIVESRIESGNKPDA